MRRTILLTIGLVVGLCASLKPAPVQAATKPVFCGFQIGAAPPKSVSLLKVRSVPTEGAPVRLVTYRSCAPGGEIEVEVPGERISRIWVRKAGCLAGVACIGQKLGDVQARLGGGQVSVSQIEGQSVFLRVNTKLTILFDATVSPPGCSTDFDRCRIDPSGKVEALLLHD